jgi:hypothetical protein
LGYSANQYRDYRLATRKKTSTQDKAEFTREYGTTPALTKRVTFYDDPPIDFVCRRLIIKWEPMFNIVHRYLYCRCVVRLSTPSHIEKEQTLFILAQCPRHNTQGICHKDYGDIDYRHDPYFDPFGGYRSFQGFIFHFATDIYETLGGERFLPTEQIKGATKALNIFLKKGEEHYRHVIGGYTFEINNVLEKAGFELPDSIAETNRNERLRRRNAAASETKMLFGIDDVGDLDNTTLIKQKLDIYDSPMGRELGEILQGKWSGKPHWAIED